MDFFRVQEDIARSWLIDTIVTQETSQLQGTAHTLDHGARPNRRDSLALNLAWDPRAPGQEDVLNQLIAEAQEHPHALTGPGQARLAIEFLDDGGDWAYRYTLNLPGPAPLTLASAPHAITSLGSDCANGIEAAMATLRDAAAEGTLMLERLAAFIAALGRGPSPDQRD